MKRTHIAALIPIGILLGVLSQAMTTGPSDAQAKKRAKYCYKATGSSAARRYRSRTYVLRPNLKQICTIGQSCRKELIRNPRYKLLLRGRGAKRRRIRRKIKVTYADYNAGRVIYMVIVRVGDIPRGSARIRLSGRCR